MCGGEADIMQDKRGGGMFVTNHNISQRLVLHNLTISSHRRARKLNERESFRYSERLRMLDRNARLQQARQDRVCGKLQASLQELNAYRSVLSQEFRVDQFDTMTLGYRAKEAQKDPNRRQRFAYETKIYHSGFNKKNLRRPIQEKMVELNPVNRKCEAYQERLEKLKSKNKVYNIDRNMPLSAIYRKYSVVRGNDSVLLAEEVNQAMFTSGGQSPAESIREEECSSSSSNIPAIEGKSYHCTPDLSPKHQRHSHKSERTKEILNIHHN